ncbi:MAG: MDR family MFS transporter [Gemmatimonadota bacterium]
MTDVELPPGLTDRDRTLTLVAILLALFLGALDQTIVSTALPRIVEDLQGVDRYAWVATAYLLASTSLVPIYGKLADTYSRRAIELGAIGLFLTGSALCGLAGEFGSLPLLGDGMDQLIAFRAVQGLGGAGLFAMAFIVIADLYPPAQRARYQGFVGAVFGVASVLGPLVGGLLTDHGGGLIPGVEGWRWVFYVNVPFGALAVWFVTTRMPPLRPPDAARTRIDWASAAFLVAGLSAAVLGLQIDKRRFPWLPGTVPGVDGWAGWVTLGLVALGLAAVTVFVLRSRRAANPVLDLSLFGNAVFARANVASFLMGAVFICVLIFLPLFLVMVVGVSATRAGVALIPLSLGLVTGSVLSGQLVARFGHYRRLLLVGIGILLVGVALLARMTAETGYWTVTAYMVLCGLGIGPSLPLYTLAIQNAVDVRRIGQATSASQFFRQIGGTVGSAVMGTVLVVTLVSALMRSGGALPAEALAGEGSGELRLAASGGGAITDAIHARFALLRARVREGEMDEGGAGGKEGEGLLPAADRERLMAARARGASPSELEAILDAAEQEAVRSAEAAVAGAFAEAVTRIYRLLLGVIVAAALVTATVPELPLRRTFQPRPPVD